MIVLLLRHSLQDITVQAAERALRVADTRGSAQAHRRGLQGNQRGATFEEQLAEACSRPDGTRGQDSRVVAARVLPCGSSNTCLPCTCKDTYMHA